MKDVCLRPSRRTISFLNGGLYLCNTHSRMIHQIYDKYYQDYDKEFNIIIYNVEYPFVEKIFTKELKFEIYEESPPEIITEPIIEVDEELITKRKNQLMPWLLMLEATLKSKLHPIMFNGLTKKILEGEYLNNAFTTLNNKPLIIINPSDGVLIQLIKGIILAISDASMDNMTGH